MNKLKKTITIITLLVIMLALSTKIVLANSVASKFKPVEYSDDFKNWIKLSDEEKQKVFMPRIYDVIPSGYKANNLLYRARLLEASMKTRFSLKDVIPENLIIRNQQQTNSCWAFASISSLETNLALYNYKNGTNTSKVYDFSERHMDYANGRNFANGVENENGYNRNVGTGGQWYYAESYFTNGLGAIDESEMPFESNDNVIDISAIQNKTVTSQVYDTIDFPDYSVESGEERVRIMNEIKQHIQDHGAVFASIHGDDDTSLGYSCYNNDTGAKFCNNRYLHSVDHAISIIGWDDNYSIENFSEDARPTSNGAWIIRNSWGERIGYDLIEFKEELFKTYQQQCIERGWNSPEEIPNEFIEQAGYTIEGDTLYLKIGDNGIMYVSYEDCNIPKMIIGIVKASDTVEYENIYQYDKYYPAYAISLGNSKCMFCNVFNKKTTGTEYVTQVSLYAPETYKCKVYINPNGEGKTKNDMQLVELKAGEYETIGTGYHTLEFARPIKLNSNKFVIAVEVEGTRSYNLSIRLEAKMEGYEAFDNITTETGKCFVSLETDFDTCEWVDLGHLSEMNDTLSNGDSTIKAFTVSESTDVSLKSIEITTPPTKTTYYVGDNFDKTGMVVKAKYNNNTEKIITDYTIAGGTNLKEGQTKVTISYNGKTAEQAIQVNKRPAELQSIEITTPPTKTTYYVGEDFDKTGMVVKAKYSDNTEKIITDYTITGGTDLKEGQTKITISYNGKTAEQTIQVNKRPVVLQSIEITTPPIKTTYYVGENFDKTGMIVIAKYSDNTEEAITNYTIIGGTGLKENQTEVTIQYEGKTAKQIIEVQTRPIEPEPIENVVLNNIEITTPPKKTTYYVGEDFDKTGMVVKARYSDNTEEVVTDYTITGGTDLKEGQTKVTIIYNGKTAEQTIQVNKRPVVLQSIEITTPPAKTTYYVGENFDKTGMIVVAKYNDNTEKAVTDYTITGGTDLKENQTSVTIKYKDKSATQKIKVIVAEKSEEEKPEAKNSNFDNAKCTINGVKYYTYTDPNNKSYLLINLVVDKVIRNSDNDSYEYYYYLSSNKEEDNIENWVKISEFDLSNDNIPITINTKDIKNFADISDMNNLYLFVKEVAINGGNQAVKISKAMELDSNVNIETYLDGEKITNQKQNNNIPTTDKKDNSIDNTIAKDVLPKTGIGRIIILFSIITAVGFVFFIRYKNLSKYVK